MLYIIYGAILLFLIVIIYGAWARKKIFKEVDRLENEKMQLMNEPVTEELSKIKGLKMSGETEERFEQWREEWDNIVTIQLPDMEEKLFDIEEMANKYRFQKAREYIKFVDEELEALKEQMKQMIEEVDQLIHSEEQNRQDINGVKDLYDETKKKLWVQKGTLGQAAGILEQRMQEIAGMFETFDTHTEEGNYFQAREVLLTIEELLNEYDKHINNIPQYLVKMEKDLPRQLNELENGLEEMAENGYPVHHFSYHWQVTDMKRRLEASLPLIENLKLEEAEKPVENIENEINDIYEKLEHEVLSRNYVEKELPVLRDKLSELPDLFEHLRAETEAIKLNYQLDEEHDKKQFKLEKHIKDLFNQFAVIDDAVEEKKQSFTALRQMINEIHAELEKIENEIAEEKKNLNHLRSDEIKAEENIKELKGILLKSQKHLRQSNIPGIPENLIYKLDEAEKLLKEASQGLTEVPISMQEINKKVEASREYVDKSVELLNETIEQAKLAELVIQYGNRYRSHNQEVNIKLLQAEDRFRNYLYEEALELALEAIEPHEPDILDKIKEQEQLSLSYS
ncbi:septation ring formation regulator EzrA [Salipaludibacillus aurantiacus]|uniref:Septation ring formation regulator EzrA n=1 Tax=Salipaludibacillus aurantiacus TaxID=1601833 RepID=A0A1H9WNM4_9BACI|nr:septation ring formation regulator EzrA [Salipaludibacillus aurantiacus]SES35508.1 septation ring formation regulator [Salipaludibacillus aurantiacus]